MNVFINSRRQKNGQTVERNEKGEMHGYKRGIPLTPEIPSG